jgi:hypothetical protein
MNRRTRLTIALLAVGILLAPSQALADGVEPQPVDWPTVAPPDRSGQPVEPQPVEWPAPEKP